MKYIYNNLIIPVIDEQNVMKAISNKLKQPESSFQDLTILRRAIDTRKKNHPLFVYTVEFDSNQVLSDRHNLILYSEPMEVLLPEVKLTDLHPMIVGMGPAGLFCALSMVERGLKPIIFDRGDKLTSRSKSVDKFWLDGSFDPNSNVQFGEGGAGSFSDGKLTSRTQNIYIRKVYNQLFKFGASDIISWEALPHLGTDGIRSIVAGIRDYLVKCGCTFNYNSQLEDLNINNGKVSEVKISGNKYCPEVLVLAIGNAARDTFRLLSNRNVELVAMSFSIGFRIIHPQEWIDGVIYGGDMWSDTLGAASYRLTSNKSGKGTYTFCMCPGGFVIAASSEPGTIVTNGMSWSMRDSSFGNSAIVTIVDAGDYGPALFDGLKFQFDLEKNSYLPGYAAPYQTAIDFINEKLSKEQNVPCLFPAVKSSLISDIFPNQIKNSLKHSLKHFDNILPGFIEHGSLIAPETRTSSPVRILRDTAMLNCSNVSNLYAVGEGSGYAGGIISSAADGYKIGSLFHL